MVEVDFERVPQQKEESTTQKGILLVLCVVGLLGSYVTWGYMQEMVSLCLGVSHARGDCGLPQYFFPIMCCVCNYTSCLFCLGFVCAYEIFLSGAGTVVLIDAGEYRSIM